MTSVLVVVVRVRHCSDVYRVERRLIAASNAAVAAALLPHYLHLWDRM